MENLLSLTELNLTGKNLLHPHSSLFIALKNLKTLDISLNGMQVLENNAFKRLSEVRSLQIQGNDLIVSNPCLRVSVIWNGCGRIPISFAVQDL